MTSSTGMTPEDLAKLMDGIKYLDEATPKVEAMETSLKAVSAAKAKFESAKSPAEKAAAEKEFRDSAGDYHSKEEAASGAIENAASKTGLSPAKVIKGFRHYMDKKETERIVGALKASQTVDLCFVMDATGSMGHHITGVKDQIRSIIGELQRAMADLNYRLSFVVYRDVGDGASRFQVHDFSSSITELERFAGSIVASGGGDECEDVVGGLAIAADMKWLFHNKMLVLCADAPCHGSMYHVGCNDDYPSGVFPGSKDPAAVLAKLKQNGVQITFLKLNSTTDKMIQEFNRLVGGGIEIVNLDCAKLAASIKESVKASLTKSITASKSKAEKLKPRTFTAATSRLETLVEKRESHTSGTTDGGSTSCSTTGRTVKERLAELKSFKDEGLITEADFQRRVDEILREV
jgi:hypothetical protein